MMSLEGNFFHLKIHIWSKWEDLFSRDSRVEGIWWSYKDALNFQIPIAQEGVSHPNNYHCCQDTRQPSRISSLKKNSLRTNSGLTFLTHLYFALERFQVLSPSPCFLHTFAKCKVTTTSHSDYLRLQTCLLYNSWFNPFFISSIYSRFPASHFSSQGNNLQVFLNSAHRNVAPGWLLDC